MAKVCCHDISDTDDPLLKLASRMGFQELKRELAENLHIRGA